MSKRSASPKILCAAVLVATLGAAASQAENTTPIRQGAGLGRLMTSELERVKIDELRFQNYGLPPIKLATQTVVEPTDTPPKQLHINGVVQRPERPAGQRVSVWIDDRVYTERELPYGLTVVKNASGNVIGLHSAIGKGKIEFAKIGDDITSPQSARQAKADKR